MAMAPELFLTPQPPRHLAELRIEPAHSAVAFSAPCAATFRKRRCLLPASSVRKRMLLELPPFDPASTPPPPPSRTPSPTPPPSPMESRAPGTSSPAGEFSFAAGLRPLAPAGETGGGGGNIFAFVEKVPKTPDGSEASSALSFLASRGKPATPASGGFVFLAAPERPKTPTSTGPTATGGFAFAPVPSPERLLTPTGSNTSWGLSFLASAPERPLTPMGSIASGGFFAASSKPSLCGAAASSSPKPARAGTDTFFPSPGPAFAHIDSPSSAAGKETTLSPAGLASPPFVFSTSRWPPPVRSGSKKRPRPHLRIDTTSARSRSMQQWEEQQRFTPPPQKLAKPNSSVNGEASRSSIVSGPCCAFFSPAKQEAKKAPSEASRSPAGSRCTSPARPSSAEKANKPEREVEVSSAACSGAEVVVRVTCKCGVHKEFCFDHRP